MAEQSISLPVTPKSTEAGANSRRNSVEGASSSKGDKKNLPHYLHASTGSCHDLCKYGRRPEFEDLHKARRSFLKKISKKPPNDQNSQPEKNSSVIKSNPKSKTRAVNTPEMIKRGVLTKSYDGQMPTFSKFLVEKKTLAEALLTKSVDSQSAVLREVLSKKKTLVQETLTRSVDSQSSISSDIWPQKKTTSSQRRKETSVARLGNSPDSKTRFSPKVLEQNVSSSEKLEVSLKQVSSKAKAVNLSANHDSSLKSKFSSPAASRQKSVIRNGNMKTPQIARTPKIAVKKIQASPRSSLSHKTSNSGIGRRPISLPASSLSKPLCRTGSLNVKKGKGLKYLSSSKNLPDIKNVDAEQLNIKNTDQEAHTHKARKPHNDMAQEKTLYVIKMETENKIFESDHNEKLSVQSSPPPLSPPKSISLPQSLSSLSHDEEVEEESEYSVTETEDDQLSEDEIEYIEEVETLKGVHKAQNRKAGMVPAEDEDVQPVKLHFRRGKVIDIQSQSTGPRRLKFRRGRVFEETQSLKANPQRSFKRRGAEVDTTDSKPGSEKVILRHQDVQGKKDAQGLFNNVIEETASKLAEIRRSKVKALVGAFETVISLQDGKPSTNSAS